MTEPLIDRVCHAVAAYSDLDSTDEDWVVTEAEQIELRRALEAADADKADEAATFDWQGADCTWWVSAKHGEDTIWGSGKTKRAAIGNLAKELLDAERFSNDDPMEDWSRVNTASPAVTYVLERLVENRRLLSNVLWARAWALLDAIGAKPGYRNPEFVWVSLLGELVLEWCSTERRVAIYVNDVERLMVEASASEVDGGVTTTGTVNDAPEAVLEAIRRVVLP